ncbi:MFS transporter [Oceanobacillus caeni]|uniref:MFS transporter n=1 Tax=Oceanobacillus caeni TaxID=405946 RepID=UPI000621D71D|nr:MFS transporter [Oceanobacillus caeni]KKE79979.1 multidrug MFS transporter [Bacilli bacterium VT-13-104]PZD84168.1 MFS transporter [Bacilli bacterium]MBU8792522.1 MFS transporter [Oceanobacillus caeni]MCR1835511.1 MFS transporter [Oceanobacillus caeni]PZD85497.1 MFS transporter [Bacilli bacterium]
MDKPNLWTKDFLIVSFTNFFLYFIHYLLISTIAIFTIDQFHASESMGGLAAGIFVIGMLFGRLFSGKYIDQVGQKKILFIGFIFSVITILLYFSITNLPILFLVRFLHGAAFGVASTATGTIVQHIIPDTRRGEGTGYYGLSTTLASAVGPFFGILINQHLGFRMNFVACTALIGISFLVSLFLKVPNVEFHKDPLEKEKGFKLSDFFEAKAIPISIVSILIGISYSSVLSFLTVYAQEINLVNAAGFFFVVYAIATLVTRPYMGKLFDMKGDNAVMYPVLIVFALGLIILGHAHQGIILLLSGACIGIGYGTFITSAQAIAVKASPKSRIGLATSTFFMFADFGAGFGPFLLGFLIPLTGYRNLYETMAILVVAATVLYYFLHGRKKSHETSSYEETLV